MNSDFNNCVGLITIFTALATTVWPINHGMGFPDSLGWVPHNAVPGNAQLSRIPISYFCMCTLTWRGYTQGWRCRTGWTKVLQQPFGPGWGLWRLGGHSRTDLHTQAV